MLTKFFKQSKPIVLLFFILLCWLALCVDLFLITKAPTNWINILFVATSISFSLFLVNFIIRKNKINKQNSFGLSLFAFGLISMLPLIESINTWWVIIFMGLFFRRLVSMLNEANLKKKTFEASVWLIIASFFEPSLILLLLLIWLTNLILSVNQLANYFIPIITFAGAFLLANAWTILKSDSWFSIQFYKQTIQFDLSWKFDIGFLYIFTLSLVCLISFPGFLQRAQVLKKIQLNLLLIAALSLLALISFIEVSSPSLYILCLFPLAAIGGEFFQLKMKKWFKEMMWWLLICLAILSFVVVLF